MKSRCPLCGSVEVRVLAVVRDEEYATSNAAYTYVECLACRAVYLPLPPTKSLKQIYPPNYYSAQPGKTLGLLQRVKSALEGRYFRKLLARVPGGSLEILDVGGGTGWMASAMRQADPRVKGSTVLDLDPGMRAAALAHGHAFVCKRIEDFRSRKTYDFISLLNLIEHVADPRRVLKSLRASLKPGGFLLIKTPNTDSLDRHLFESSYWGGYHAPRHWVLFDRKNFAHLAQECGFEIESFSYTQGAPQWAASLMALLARWAWVKVRPERPMFEQPLSKFFMALGAAFDMLRGPWAKTDQMFFVLKIK